VLAAKDTGTGRRVYTRTAFFFICRWVIPGLWGIAALASLTAPHLLQLGQIAGTMGEKDASLFAMPFYLSMILPSGLMGILVAAMLAADMSTDSSYMLTWGSVIYNDILAPFRKTRWSEKTGILVNRFIVAIIGLFLLFWGLWYKLEGNLWEYLQTTGTIYLSSMSIMLIGCCYWKRANSWGAIAAIILGAACPVAALTLNMFKQGWASRTIGDAWVNIGTFAIVAVAMVVGSLLKPRKGDEICPSTGSGGSLAQPASSGTRR
jgi:SSS family solute:Na+ symporter